MRLLALLLLAFCTKAWGFTPLKDWEVCFQGTCRPYTPGEDLLPTQKARQALVRTQFSRADMANCSNRGGCWIFLGEVADSAVVRLNGAMIGSHYYYAHYESITALLPPSMVQDKNVLEVDITEMNQDRFGLKSAEVGIGSKQEVEAFQTKDWVIRTGSTLLSAFTCLVLLLGLAATYTIYRNRKILPLIGLAFTSALYLISFSEIPRRFFDPVWLSGPIHFALRLGVDFWIVAFALGLYKTNKRNRFLRWLPPLYVGGILHMVGGWTLGIYEYEFFKTAMLLVAPLVMGGSLSLTLLAWSYHDSRENAVNLPAFVLFLALQAHDLAVFWQLAPGMFMIKWYLPFAIIAFTWIYVRRRVKESRIISASAALGDGLKKVAHDMRAPLDQLHSLFENPMNEEKRIELGTRSLQELSLIASDILGPSSSVRTSEQLLAQSVREAAVKFDSLRIQTHFSRAFDWLQMDAQLATRVFNNLFSNALKAGATDVSVVGETTKGIIRISITDNGQGIPTRLQPYIFDMGVTSDAGRGHGLGLAFCQQRLKELGFKLELERSKPANTVFLLTARMSRIALIDDNQLVRDTWGTLGTSECLEVMTYSSFDDFLSDPPSPQTPIFVDQNLDCATGISLLPKFHDMGYHFMTITTGDVGSVNAPCPVIGKAFPV